MNPFGVNENLEVACTNFYILSDNNLLRDALELINFGEYGGIIEDLHSLLETGLSEDTDVCNTIDTIPVNWGELASSGHPVRQSGQMPVVDVDAVGLQHFSEFVEERLPCGLDAQHVEDLGYAVAGRAATVDFGQCEHFFKVCPLGDQHFVLVVFVAWDFLGVGVVHSEHLLDVVNSLNPV